MELFAILISSNNSSRLGANEIDLQFAILLLLKLKHDMNILSVFKCLN